jgi:hypothetical protein
VDGDSFIEMDPHHLLFAGSDWRPKIKTFETAKTRYYISSD